jgi:hypothetical protein
MLRKYNEADITQGNRLRKYSSADTIVREYSEADTTHGESLRKHFSGNLCPVIASGSTVSGTKTMVIDLLVVFNKNKAQF